MDSVKRSLLLFSVALIWSCALGLQRPPPRYSQQYMPETSFTCRNKIVGSYYADPETDCQLFHVCVSVAGSIQDYKFLCPNDTAFDQESQTCADWYDVDCEAATLYYASDNFDLYRIGSGLESVHYDLRSDAEPQDNLQRSESNDPVRSSANTLNRVANNYNANSNSNSNSNGNSRDILRGSSSSNFYNNRQGREEDFETEKAYKEDQAVETKKKPGVRKVSRKQQYSGVNSNNYSPSTTTVAPPTSASSQRNYNGNNYYNNNGFNQRVTNNYPSSTTARPVAQENYNRNQKYNAPASTYRPSTTYQETHSTYSSPVTTARTTVYNAYNTNYNQQTASTYSQSTTAKPVVNYNTKNSYQAYNNNNNNNNQYTQSTTIAPSSANYPSSDFSNFRSYNNIQRTSSVAYPTTTASPTVYDPSFIYNNNNNNGQYRSSTSTRSDVTQTTAKYSPYYGSSSYAPTTYSPATKKYANVDNTVAQTARSVERYSPQVDSNNNNNQYYDKSQSIKASTQYYDSTKAPKKATQYNYDNKYYSTETSTANYDFGRSSAGIGFSPASINHLAETPRTTTPYPRRAASATTYNPNSYNSNNQRSQQSPTTTPRGSTYVSGSARPFSSTSRVADSTTPRTKTGKKNDYDYAYYDNAGPLEYDGLEDAAGTNKESAKISRN